MERRHVKPQLLFWTYLFQIAIVSLLMFIWSVLVVLDVIPNKAGTALGRDRWLLVVLPMLFAALSIVSCVAILLYRNGKITWAHWTIGAGAIYTLYFIWWAYSVLNLYAICMVLVNMVCTVELFKYIIWRKRSEGEYHVVDKNDERYLRYTGSYDDCLRLYEIEYDDFKQSH